MNFYRDLGLKKENLYEILATTYALDEENNEIIPNMACMGIRIVDNDIIKISPYPNTTTYSNLKSNKFLAINFVNDVSLYALAALKEFPPDFKESQKDYYKYKEVSENRVQIPYIKEAWATLYGEVVGESQKTKKNGLGEVNLTEFTIKIFELEKKGDSFNLFNRAENLVLEAIILATRLKVAKEISDQELFNSIYNEIIDYSDDIKRFGQNKAALKALKMVLNFVERLN